MVILQLNIRGVSWVALGAILYEIIRVNIEEQGSRTFNPNDHKMTNTVRASGELRSSEDTLDSNLQAHLRSGNYGENHHRYYYVKDKFFLSLFSRLCCKLNAQGCSYHLAKKEKLRPGDLSWLLLLQRIECLYLTISVVNAD